MSTLTDLFSGIANAIRGKTGNTGTIIANDFPTAISNIPDLVSSTADATAIAGNLFSGKTAYAKGAKIVGTMVDRGNLSQSLNCGETFTIPVGYHSGAGIISANSLASQTVGTATVSDIINGKTAWVNGNKLTGTLSKIGNYVYRAIQYTSREVTANSSTDMMIPFYYYDSYTISTDGKGSLVGVGAHYYSLDMFYNRNASPIGKFVSHNSWMSLVSSMSSNTDDDGDPYCRCAYYSYIEIVPTLKGYRVTTDNKGDNFYEDGISFTKATQIY